MTGAPDPTLKLMAVLAHPDDESLGIGGTLAKYALRRVETFVVTATRGEGGRYRGHRARRCGAPRAGGARRDSRSGIARRRVGARRARGGAARLSRSGSSIARIRRKRSARIVAHLRRVRPDVVVTFGPDGAYGHPDHIAISQFTTAALVAAADPSFARRRDGRLAAACRAEALLPGVAGGDVGGLRGGVQEADLHGRRCRAAGGAVARLGDHHGHRHATVLADRVARGVLSRVAAATTSA